jgi:hypothetical protein
MPLSFTIDDLRQCPQFFDTVADRIWQAWWQADGTPLGAISGRLRENMTATPVPFALVAHDGAAFLGTTSVIASAGSAVRGHENRKAETGEMVQGLVHPDQRPEPGMLLLLRYTKPRCTNSLCAVDRDVNGKIDQGDKPESRRDDQDQRHCNRKMHKAVGEQRKRPSGPLVLADGHPGILQDKICDDMLDGKKQHPSDQRTNRNRRGHGGKGQADALARLGMARKKEWRRSAQLLLKARTICRYCPFMTSPDPECTCAKLEKHRM